MIAMTSGNVGSTGGLPNSRMSAPPMKILPAPLSTVARIAASAEAWRMAAAKPLRTSAEVALTGGLSIVTTRMPSTTVPVTTEENSRLSAMAVSVRYNGKSLYFDLGPIFDQRDHLHRRHGGEVLADHIAISAADAFQIGGIFSLVGEIPGHGGDVLRPAASFRQNGDDVFQCLLGLLDEIVGLELLLFVPADLAADI